MEIKKFKNTIAFDFENEIVNATDMLKNFPKKKMNNFLRQKQTKEFIKVLENKQLGLNTPISVIEKKAGRYGGTYMHRLLALKFAAWLSPEFELWIFEVFDNYLKEQIRQAEIRESYAWNALDRHDLYK